MFKSKQSRVYLAFLTVITALLAINVAVMCESTIKPATSCTVCKGTDKHCIYNMDTDELAKDYQIQLEDDEAVIWDGYRYVGTIPFNETCIFNKIMLKDNH